MWMFRSDPSTPFLNYVQKCRVNQYGIKYALNYSRNICFRADKYFRLY